MFTGTPDEPHVTSTDPQMLANGTGLSKTGHHGPSRRDGRLASEQLPSVGRPPDPVVAQLATRSHLLDDEAVGYQTRPRTPSAARNRCELDIPIFVSDMSFGALSSQEAKVALAKGAELAGTGICSGEGGMLPEEQAANSQVLLRARLRLASATRPTKLKRVASFSFQGRAGGQDRDRWTPSWRKGAPSKIAEVREGCEPGEPAISAHPGSPTWTTLEPISADFAAEVREIDGRHSGRVQDSLPNTSRRIWTPPWTIGERTT